MKILVGIPCLYGYKHTEDAINSVLNQRHVDLLLIDNGGNDEIKTLFKNYENNSRVTIIRNPVNIFVNPAWNQILKHFLESEYNHLVIMNSDILMQNNWSDVLRYRVHLSANETLIPRLVKDIHDIQRAVSVENTTSDQVITAAGFFITLSKEQAKLVYPITEDCKVWYGDNWIYEILMAAGHRMIIPHNLVAHHGLSQTIQRLSGVHLIIDQDNKNWQAIVVPKMMKVIEQNKL